MAPFLRPVGAIGLPFPRSPGGRCATALLLVTAGTAMAVVAASMTKGVKATDSDKLVMKAYNDKLSAEELQALTDRPRVQNRGGNGSSPFPPPLACSCAPHAPCHFGRT
ncbi:MAG: hypothetical protein ABR538_08715 [Candidatus Binatia bacterium]